MPIPLLAAAAIPAVYQGIKGVSQKIKARKLKESKFIPEELLMNKDLATQQAYSRRAPGQSFAEEQVRRNTANQISAGQRSFGGDANKMAAIASGAVGQANDATANIAANGQRFSEGAFNRLGYANTAIAGQKRQNRSEYLETKAALDASGDQNIFNSINNLSSLAIAGAGEGIDAGTKSSANAKIAMGKDLNKVQAGRGAGGGDPYIKEGRMMKKTARRQARQSNTGSLNNYMMMKNGGYGGYGPGYGGVWNMPGQDN